MKKRKLLIPIFIGLIVGQVFAEGDRPFHIYNTIRFGYTDNVDRTPDGESSTYVTDTIDFAFNAALSDRTDLLLKSQIVLRTDDSENQIHPNLYAVLSHQVSPRLLLSASEYYKRADKSTGTANGRHNYFINTAGLKATYVLTEKDRLDGSLDYRIRRHDSEIEEEDSTTIEVGLSWERELIPQRTSAKVNLRERWVDYPNSTVDWSSQETDFTLEIAHTLNPSWQARVEGGATYVRPDFDKTKLAPTSTADDDPRLNPLFKVGVIYSPSPRTRLTGDYSYRYTETDDANFGGQQDSEFRFGFQHEITKKILAKATARFLETEHDGEDNATGAGNTDEDRMDLEFRLTYKLNRINFLEAGLKYSEVGYDDSTRDWDQTMFDLGWRVEL